MATTTDQKHTWLIDLLTRKGDLTFLEINREWQNSNLNPEEKPLARTTFNRWMRGIFDDFGLKVDCNRSTNKYSIVNIHRLKNGGVRKWLLDAMSISHLLNERDAIAGRIILEDIPSGQEYLVPITEAMKDGHKVAFVYQDFIDAEPYEVVLAPYFVKLFERRWNVIGKIKRQKELQRFSLDRIKSLKILEERFNIPEEFDAATYFSDCYGVTHYDIFGDMPKAQRIVLRISAIQREYIRTLKIHHSQREIATTDEYSDFELYLRPTYDFMQFVLTLHEFAEVIAPQELRQKLGALICGMADKYIDSLESADE